MHKKPLGQSRAAIRRSEQIERVERRCHDNHDAIKRLIGQLSDVDETVDGLPYEAQLTLGIGLAKMAVDLDYDLKWCRGLTRLPDTPAVPDATADAAPPHASPDAGHGQ